MNDKAFKELRGIIKTPSKHLETLSTNPESIREHLSSKQILRFSNEERDEIFSDKERCGLTSRFYKLYHNIRPIEYESEFPTLIDGYSISEYFGSKDICVITEEYLRYIKQSRDGYILNMYNGIKSDRKHPIYNDKIQSIDQSDIPEYSFEVPDQIVYSIFDEILYDSDIDLSSYIYKSPLINMNLPYEYYSKILIPENIYCYDIISEKHWFCGKSSDEIDIILQDMVQNGIQTPLLMRIMKGVIRSADDETYLYLLLAKHLKLPSIPASIFIGDENHLIPDTIDEFIPLTEDQLAYTNTLFKPYFLF